MRWRRAGRVTGALIPTVPGACRAAARWRPASTPHRNGAYSNFRDIPLDPEIPNIYSLLRGAAYHSAHIGKCHYKPVPYDQTRPDATLPYDDFREYYLSLGH